MSILTERDHINMDAFLGHILDDYKDGLVTKERTVSALAHVMAALDNGEESEVRTWLEQGRKFVRGEECTVEWISSLVGGLNILQQEVVRRIVAELPDSSTLKDFIEAGKSKLDNAYETTDIEYIEALSPLIIALQPYADDTGRSYADFFGNKSVGSTFVFVEQKEDGSRHEFHFGTTAYGKGHAPVGGHKPIIVDVNKDRK